MSSNITLEKFRGLSLNILINGRRIGFIDAFESNEIEKGVWVEYVYIVEKHRNSKIGTHAIKKAITKWREMGYSTVTLNDVHWDKPQDFWGKLGFKGNGKRKTLNL